MTAPSTSTADNVLMAKAKRGHLMQWLILALALLLLGAQLAYTQYESHKQIESEATTLLENHSLVVVEELERRFKAISVVLAKLRETAPIQLTQLNGQTTVNRELKTLAQAMEGLRTLSVLNSDGTMLASSRSELVGKNFARREYFVTARDHPKPDVLFLSEPFVTDLGIYTMTVSRMISGPQGEFAGLVVATLDTESMGDLLHSLHAGEETTLSIIHGDGALLVLIPERKSAPPGLLLRVPGSLFERHMNSGQMASLMAGESYSVGSERLISMRTFQPVALNLTRPLVVSAARSEDEVFKDWQERLETHAALFLIMSVLCAFALYFHQRRQNAFNHQIQQKELERQRYHLVLQRFIDHLPGTAYVKDADLRTLMANRQFETLLGIDPKAMIGKSSQEFFPGEFGEKILQDDRKVLESGITTVIEEHFNGRDYESTKFVIDDGSGHRQLGGMTMDITQRKQAERDLEARLQEVLNLNQKLANTEENMRRLSTAVEQSPASIVITDLNANIIFVNQAFTEASGYSPEEAIGKNPRILQSGETAPDTYRMLWPTLTSGQVWRGEFINQRKNGSRYLELATISPVRDSSGQVTHYVAVKEDITERRRDEIELIKHRQHLEELVELRTNELAVAKSKADAANRAKSEFLANMSHEIRTPMNAIIGLNYLLLHSEMAPEQRDKLSKVSAAAEHLLQIINDILDLSKIEAGKLVLEQQAFSPGEVLQSIAVLIRDQAAGKGLQLFIDPGSLPPTVIGDETRLRQVLLNFASNAVKFTQQGSISLAGEMLVQNGKEITCRFSVSDTGIGIRPEETDRLFNAFEQLDGSTTKQFGGTGLGLAIARHLAQLMGGEIGVDSTPEQGSRFWITAKLEVAANLPHTDALPAVSEQKLLKGRVLLVEDDEINREIGMEMLAVLGAEAVSAENGQVAVDCFKASNFDLILMDIQMPVLDGIEACRQIRALPNGQAVPIVAMTANVFIADRARYRSAGMNDFLPKPAHPESLYQMLRKYLASSAEAIRQIPATAEPERPQLTRQELSSELGELAELLATGSSLAGERFGQLQKTLELEFPAEYRLLKVHISCFDFEAALPVVIRIQGQLR